MYTNYKVQEYVMTINTVLLRMLKNEFDPVDYHRLVFTVCLHLVLATFITLAFNRFYYLRLNKREKELKEQADAMDGSFRKLTEENYELTNRVLGWKKLANAKTNFVQAKQDLEKARQSMDLMEARDELRGLREMAEMLQKRVNAYEQLLNEVKEVLRSEERDARKITSLHSVLDSRQMCGNGESGEESGEKSGEESDVESAHDTDPDYVE